MDLLYKTLFEIKLMHEYFLTKEDGTNLFSEPDPQKRLDLLDQLYAMERPAMDTDIGFDFPDTLHQKMQERVDLHGRQATQQRPHRGTDQQKP